ncbi:hypothetical protein D9615_001623 [Tricholomella constricta]|uniref:ADF-H domain-containing protein n=1 Tax=Tricholomella constricta TaxID=117010 RepID=A0A8H5HP00_9AGAR|nr:hypothetical protein D9615_001623 [Tricholomella constricta]
MNSQGIRLTRVRLGHGQRTRSLGLVQRTRRDHAAFSLRPIMSATSGITVASHLASVFANANISSQVRFIKVSITNESLTHDLTIPVSGTFEDDLRLLQSPDVLEDTIPAYLLAKVAQSNWITISYVPDSAKVRDKMLYASTRASLLKAMGSTLFTDAIFATSKADLTPEAYASHKRHIAAPKPLSTREKDMADVRAAESGDGYEGSRTRASHLRTGVGFAWAQDLEQAVVQLGQGEACALIVLEVDRATETLTLISTSEINIDILGSALPSSQPCYALFAWPHAYTTPPRREISKSFVFNPVMIYSSGVLTTYLAVKGFLVETSPTAYLAPRKVETSDPRELDEAHLKTELGLDIASVGAQPAAGSSNLAREGDEKKAFARPKGPARKR